jgi:hypothetical protein
MKNMQDYIDEGYSKILRVGVNDYLVKFEIGFFVFIMSIKISEIKFPQKLATMIIKDTLIICVFIIHMKYNSVILDYVKNEPKFLAYEDSKNLFNTYKKTWFFVIFGMTLLFIIDVVNYICNNFAFLKKCIII